MIGEAFPRPATQPLIDSDVAIKRADVLRRLGDSLAAL